MNKHIIVLALNLLVLCLGFAPTAHAQAKAKKPRVVVVPSDVLLKSMNLLTETDDMGATSWVANYEKAFLDKDLSAAISKFNELMRDRGFPVTSLAEELKQLKTNTNHVIPIDIKIGLSYNVEQ